MKSVFIKVYRLSVGFLILAAITTQFFTFKQTPVNFFSYFTVLSNLLASFVLIVSALKTFDHNRIDLVRGAATLYILITGLGFTILLGGKNEEFISWVNIVLHYISPTVMLLDWIFTPSIKITIKKSLYWMIFLLIYLAYSLVRGVITSWYPYEFLDPTVIGYQGVFGYFGILTISAFAITLLIVKLNEITNPASAKLPKAEQ